ncbi:hypothetical protein [Actibacterium sp. D379-3]
MLWRATVLRGWVRLAGLMCLAAGGTLAQGASDADLGPGGLKLTFGVESTLRADDNYGLDPESPGDTVLFDNTLSFGLLSETQAARLAFDLSGVLRYADLPGQGGSSGFEDPAARLLYRRESATSRIEFSGNWRRSDLDFIDPLRDPVLIEDPDAPGEVSLATETGTRTASSYGVTWETGLGGPLGLTVSVRHRELDYKDTTDPDYYDNETDRLSAALRLRLSPVTEGIFTLQAEEYSAQNTEQTDRSSRHLRFDLTHELDKTTQVTAAVGYSRIEADEFLSGLRDSEVDEGAILGLGVRRDLPGGRVSVTYDRGVTTTGARDTLRLGREIALPRGALSFDAGASRGGAGDTELVARAALTREMPRGMLEMSLGRDVRTNDDEEDVLSTKLALGWTHALNTGTSLSLDMDFARSEDGGAGGAETTDRTSLRLAWNRDLTREVTLSAGYEHRRLNEEDTPEARSNAVFLVLRRDFGIRP